MTELLEEPQALEPVDDWSDVDPDYEPILPEDDEQDDIVEDPSDLDEDLTEEEIEIPDDLAELLPFWVSYELHGRNLDAETAWERLAVEDFDGDLEVEVDGLTAGARWEFRVRLIDRDGRHSRFSEPLVIDLPTDFTPPPAPTEPIVRNVRGYTAVGWDGLLQGPIPGDMSHVQLYVQQQHPEGDPDGEPGDPRRITTMSTAGEHPLLQFLANVLHKAWFTAVDTTGNESPWSPQVEFTPEPPVDTDAIESELGEARDRLEQAEQDLAAGMAERKAEIENLQNNVIPSLEQDLINAQADAASDLQDLDTTLRDSFSTQLDTVLEALSGAGRTWSQDDPPPAGVTYEWAGEPHASQSLKYVDGVEVARNLVPNPSYEVTVDSPDRLTAPSSRWSSDTQVADLGVLYGSYSWELEVSGDANTFTYFGKQVETHGNSWVAFSIPVQVSTAGPSGTRYLRGRVGTREPEGPWVFSEHQAPITAEPGDQVVITGSAEVPDGHTEARVFVYVYADMDSNEPPKEGWIFRQDGFHVAGSGAEADALAQVETYFDGDTLDDRQNDLWINSNGTQHRWDDETKQWTAFSNAQLQQSVDQALSKADSALTQAGTKNTVYYGTDEDPGFDGVVAGDQYRQTDGTGGPTIARLRWNGVQWLSDAVTSEVIDNLDVGKLTAGSVTTPEAVIEKLMADGITARAATISRLTVAADNMIQDPEFEDIDWWDDSLKGLGEGLLDFGVEHTRHGVTRRSIRALSDVDWDPHLNIQTPAFPCEEGEEFVLTFWGESGGALVPPEQQPERGHFVNFRWLDQDGNVLSFGDALDNWGWDTSWQFHEYIQTAPEGARYFHVFWRFLEPHRTAAVRMAGPRLRRALDGRMVINGLLQASTAELQELFFDEAVGNAVWADAVRSRLLESQGIITEDMIATGAITTPKLTVTEEMVAQIAKLVRIEAGSLASNDIEAMRIVSSLIESSVIEGRDANGELTYRLDGMDNLLMGRIHAGMTEGAGITMDYGNKTRRSGVTDQGDPANVWTIQTPYLNFHSGRSYRLDQEPSIFVDSEVNDMGNDGMLVINPGYPEDTPIYRARLNVVGDLAVNRIDARNEIISPVGLRVDTENDIQPGGLYRESGRTRLEGRNPTYSGPHDMLTTTRLGPYGVTTGQFRGSLSWGQPAPTGTRHPVMSCHVASQAYDVWDAAYASSANVTASGFNWVIRSSWSDVERPVWINILSSWQ